MRRYGVLLTLLMLGACGTYTPGLHHGGDEADTGSHLGGVDGGSSDLGATGGTTNNGHFGLGSMGQTGSH